MDEEITEIRRPPRPPPTPAAAGPVRPGSTLDHLRLDSLLYRGASSEVYQAQNLLARKPCLVKVFHPALVASRVRWGRFVHESKMVASLRQPGIADVYSHHIIDGTGLVVMAPSAGNSLREVLKASGPLSRRTFLPVVRGIGLALAPVHAAGLAHKRLHPGQILVQWAGTEPTIQLLDFGVHHLHTSLSEETGGVPRAVDQALWVSPEQAKGEPGDLRSDVYSLAVILYQMIAGRPPFLGDTLKAVLDQHLSEPPPPPSRFVNTAADLEETLLKALEKDPRKRTQSVEAMLAGIDPGAVTGQHLLVKPGSGSRALGLAPSPSKEIELASVGPVHTVEPAFTAAAQPGRLAVPPPPPPPPAPARTSSDLRLPRQRLWLFVALGAAVVLCGGVLAYVLSGNGEQGKSGKAPSRGGPAAGRAANRREAPPPVAPRAAPPAPPPAAAPTAAAPPRPAPPPNQAELEVVSSDPAAQVFVDGQPRGMGRNVIVPGLKPGRHRVQLVSGGKQGPERQLLLRGGEQAKVVF